MAVGVLLTGLLVLRSLLTEQTPPARAGREIDAARDARVRAILPRESERDSHARPGDAAEEPQGASGLGLSAQAQTLRTDIVGVGESLRGKAEEELLAALGHLGDELGKSRDVVPAMLELLREEADAEVLSWLAATIGGRTGALNRISDDEWTALIPLLLHGEPAARRRAVAGIHSDPTRAPPREVKAALQEVLRAERVPDVLAVAARTLLAHSEAWGGVESDVLAAYRRMPAGRSRREVAHAYQGLATPAALLRRFEESHDAAERNDWACAIAVRGRPLSTRSFRAVYASTTDPEFRRKLLQRAAPADAGLLRELREAETDDELRAELGRCIAAVAR